MFVVRRMVYQLLFQSVFPQKRCTFRLFGKQSAFSFHESFPRGRVALHLP